MNILRAVGWVVLGLGFIAAVISNIQTFGHVPDPAYNVVNYPVEEGATTERTVTHSNYHAFREGLLSLGVLVCIAWSGIAAPRSPGLWPVAFLLACVYTLGWWLPWPLFGLRAPHADAELAHTIGTVGLMMGMLLLRPRPAT